MTNTSLGATKPAWAVLLRTSFLDMSYLLVGFLASWSLWTTPGMPLTHDGMGVQVVECFRRAYVAHDYFPHWFSFLSNGYGSGLPMLYHRLHGQVFAILALAVGSLEATKLSVPICLCIGGAGMRRFVQEHHVRPWLAWICGALLVTTNYVLTDWFVRGAVAELLGFMLVPWCLFTLVRMLRGTSGFVAFAFAFTLLFYAHMLAFYFSMFFVLSATVTHVASHWRYGWRALRRPLTQLALAGGLLSLTLGPYIAAMQFAAHMASVTDIKMRADAAAYVKLSEYFFDSNHDWTYARNTGQMSVEIGRWVLIGSLIFAVVIKSSGRAALKRQAWLWLPAVVLLALQPKELSFVFEKLPGASKVQFPLRLLVYIVPAAISCFALIAEHALRSGRWPLRWGVPAFGIFALWMQLYMDIDAQRDSATTALGPDLVASALSANDPSSTKLAVYEGWEYFVPGRFHRPGSSRPFLEASRGCLLTSPELLGTSQSATILFANQFRSFTFVVHGHDCLVTLSQFNTPLLDFEVERGHVTALGDATVFNVSDDGAVVHVRQRRLLDMSFRWLNEAFHLSTLPTLEP